MRGWRRPYSLGADVWLAVVNVAAAPGALALFTVLLAGAAPWWFLAWLYMVGLAGLAVGVRQVMLGVYVSDDGVMSRSLTRTRRIAWPSVSGFRSARAHVPAGPPIRKPLRIGCAPLG